MWDIYCIKLELDYSGTQVKFDQYLFICRSGTLAIGITQAQSFNYVDEEETELHWRAGILTLAHWICINLALCSVVICRCPPSCVAAPECVLQEKTACSSGESRRGAPMGDFPYTNWFKATAH